MARKGVLIGLLVAVLASTAWGFDVYFADSAGQKIGKVWEGQYVYIVINDPDKGACGIDQFQADVVVFDWKTGAWWGGTNVWFRELGGIGSGKYFLVRDKGSNTKIGLQIGSRYLFGGLGPAVGGMLAYTHWTGLVSPTTPDFGVAGFDAALLAGTAWSVGPMWVDGDWEYLDFNIVDGELPADQLANRLDLGMYFGQYIPSGFSPGRFENNDTVIVIARDISDVRNYAQNQVKIIDIVSKLTVTPGQLDYGCGPACSNIIVTIEDKDEDLNCNEIEYVPFWVIVNPGSWDPQTWSANGFCSLIRWGGTNSAGESWALGATTGEGTTYDGHTTMGPIRWYNIYAPNAASADPGRYISYADAPWWNPSWPQTTSQVMLAQFFAPETGVGTGVFELNLGNLEDFQEILFQDPAGRGVRFPAGTTIAFYYIDPNDFDDMDLTTAVVGNRPHSQTFITDANGIPMSEVKIGTGWGGMYIRVYDADANVEACCQDKVVVHICDPHNEDDSEYYVIDEISNDSGIFFSQNGIPLLPVWDAVSGYQLVFDDWRVESFNEDTIFVRYNSLEYTQDSLNALGDGDPNDTFFPPEINELAARNQYWDVSFAKAKVYDTQVFDGTTHHMRFLNGQYQPVDTIPISGSLYLEVTDLDQNEHPALRELVFGGWNKDADATDTTEFDEDTMPFWGSQTDAFFGEDDGLFNMDDWRTPRSDGGALPFLAEESITGKLPTVKVFMFNAQRGTWERMDLRETAVGSGIFRSTTCVLVSSSSLPGLVAGVGLQTPMGHLNSAAGDTIMAFYQDPSNHSDVSIISIKVNEGGAGGITPPTVALSVAFDKANYNPGDTVTITVTDEQYAGAMEIAGAAKPLILKTADGTELASWTQIPAVSGQPGKFRVSYVLPATVTGTITALYTDPLIASRTAQAQATVAAPVLASVSDVKPVPEVFSTSTAFTVYAQPAGAVPNKVTVNVYDLTGRNVATLTGTNTTTVSWNGGTLRNGAYIYVWTVEGGNPVQTWTGKGFVYIKR